MNRKSTISLVIAVLLLLAAFEGALAGSVSAGGMTLYWPDYPLTGPALLSCEPWFESTAKNLTLTNVPAGSTVLVNFTWSNPYTGSPNYLPPITISNAGGDMIIPISYPQDTTQWPVWNTVTNERAISVAAFVRVTKPDGTVVKLVAKQWWVRCLPPPPPFQGCTPGYWRQEQHFDSWVPTGYWTTDDFELVFGVNASFDPDTLLDAVWLGGGGEYALARHAVAAILNAAHPQINYYYSVAEIIAGVQNAYATGNYEPFKDSLDAANNAGCPLD